MSAGHNQGGRLFPTVIFLGFVLGLTGFVWADSELPTVSHVDLTRYMGRWYEVARLPNRFEQNCVGDVTADYAVLPGGRLSVVNQCRVADGRLIAAHGVARLANPAGTTAKLKVRFAPAWLGFLPFVWGDYWVLALAEDYSWAVVGAPDRQYLWVLSRTPGMAESQIDTLLAKVIPLGFDVSKVVRVPHNIP